MEKFPGIEEVLFKNGPWKMTEGYSGAYKTPGKDRLKNYNHNGSRITNIIRKPELTFANRLSEFVGISFAHTEQCDI